MRQKEEEFQERIEDMQDIESLRKYLCPKSNWNPVACNTCQGIRNCTAGQRALALIEKEQNPTRVQADTERARARFREALLQEDPMGWLLKRGAMTQRAASEFLVKSREKYPDIVEEIEGTEKGMTTDELEDDDMITVNDFLKEVGGTTPVESKEKKRPESHGTVQAALQEKFDELDKRRDAMVQEKQRILLRIEEIEQSMKEIEAAQFKIMEVKEMFTESA